MLLFALGALLLVVSWGRAVSFQETIQQTPTVVNRHSITVRNLSKDGPPPTFTPSPTALPTVTPIPALAPVLTVPGLICSYSWSCGQALRVAYCESKYQNVQNYAGGPYFGIFQLSRRWFGYYGYDFALWAIPEVNVAVAFLVWQDYGWGPWSCKP